MQEKSRIKILMIITSFHPFPMGGSEKQAFLLAKELQKLGADLSILSLGGKGAKKEEIIEAIKIYRVRSFQHTMLSALKNSNTSKKKPVVKLQYEKGNPDNFIITGKKTIFSLVSYFIFFIRAVFLLKRKNQKVDIVYVPIMEWTAFIGVLIGKLKNANTVIKDSTVNGITNILRYPFGKWMQQFIITNGDFIAMTRAIHENYLKEGIPKEKIHRIPNGVELSEFSANREISNCKFIFIGNLYQQPAKGIDVLLKAWKIAVQEAPDILLYIMGDGYTKEYDQYAEQLGISQNLRFLGKQDSSLRLLEDASCFILPSRREGLSNALLEAMSAGVACIATDISGNQDLITDRENGILVPVEDEYSLARAIVYLYKNPEKGAEMGMKARKTIEQAYTLNQVSKKYFDLFTKMRNIH